MIRFRCSECGYDVSIEGVEPGASPVCPNCGNVARASESPRGPALGPRSRVPAAGQAWAPALQANMDSERQGEAHVLWEGRPSVLCYLGNYVLGGVFILAGSMWLTMDNGPIGLGCVSLLIGAWLALSAILGRACTRLTITSWAIRIRKGVLSRQVIELPASAIREVRLRQSPSDRILGIGAIGFFTSGDPDAKIVFRGLSDPDEVLHLVNSLIGDDRHAMPPETAGERRSMAVVAGIVAAVIALLVVTYFVVLSVEDRVVEERVAKIHQLVSVGMDVDEAADRLQKAGLKVGEKYFPTASHDYYMVYVVVRKDAPAIDVFRYSMGYGGGRRLWVVIEADPTGKITSIR
ncbi:MAG: PH domain-containing protein [Planctomycetota bacterium]|nr:PH domain-containing protein [Planctomycetota bacterium]